MTTVQKTICSENVRDIFSFTESETVKTGGISHAMHHYEVKKMPLRKLEPETSQFK